MLSHQYGRVWPSVVFFSVRLWTLTNFLSMNMQEKNSHLVNSQNALITRHQGRFPFNQKFWNFLNEKSWYGNFLGKVPEDLVEFLKSGPVSRKILEILGGESIETKISREVCSKMYSLGFSVNPRKWHSILHWKFPETQTAIFRRMKMPVH